MFDRWFEFDYVRYLSYAEARIFYKLYSIHRFLTFLIKRRNPVLRETTNIYEMDTNENDVLSYSFVAQSCTWLRIKNKDCHIGGY